MHDDRDHVTQLTGTSHASSWVRVSLSSVTSSGGGCKKLYRKQQNSSSSYCPDVHTVRKDGTYIYEEFLSTFGTDVKVSTVYEKHSRRLKCWLLVCFSSGGAPLFFPKKN